MLSSLSGGLLIGLGAALFWFATGRVAGVTGLVHDVVRRSGGSRSVSVAFVLGLLAAGALAERAAFRDRLVGSQIVTLVVAGILAGFGARLGGGCTSGHGVCGLARLSTRSIVATCTFMATGAATVFVARHVLPLIGGAR